MQLIVNELRTQLYQEITVQRRQQLSAIRPHLVIVGAPAGSLQVQIWDTQNQLIDASDVVAISAISSAAAFHGYVRFLIQTMLKEGTHYRIALVPSGGYAFSESAYVGWAIDYDLKKVARDFTPAGNAGCPQDLEIWSNNELVRECG